MIRLNLSLALLASVVMSFGTKPEDQKHPIRDEIVEGIKAKKTSWKPKEVEDNHLRHRTIDGIKNSMGHLGTSPAPLGSELMRTISHSAYDIFKSMTSMISKKDESFKLK